MRVLFTGGGTAGHINPALAVAATVKEKDPHAEILYVGTERGMESKLVPAAGFAFETIDIRGFVRSFSPKSILKNLATVGKVLGAEHRAGKILEKFRPDVVMGTGGYVCGPVVKKAAAMGIPTVIHEQNAFPGVTIKLLSKKADRVLLAVEEAGKHLDPSVSYTVTGNPVRSGFLYTTKKEARRELGLDDRMAVVSFGGSLGAERVNMAVADLIAWSVRKKQIQHIHATGRYGTELMPQLLTERRVNLAQNPQVDIREYIDNMPQCFAAADLIICRAGAITLSELQVAGRAAILIPSPNVAENHQYHNAMVLVHHGAARIIEEKDLTGEKLIQMVKELLENPEKLAALSKNAAKMAIVDTNDRIYDVIRQLAGNK